MADDIRRADEVSRHSNDRRYGLFACGGVALQIAIRHPESVAQAVWSSRLPSSVMDSTPRSSHHGAMGPSAAEGMKQSPLYQLYPNVNGGVFTSS